MTRRRDRSARQGRLYIVGIGPGSLEHLSRKAYGSLTDSEVIVGYRTYIKLLGNLTVGKEVITSGMTQEKKRVKLAIEKALEGKRVCLVSSGDSGVYGMAGLALEFLKPENAARITIEIIPGIMAATACASLLGAPLANDFAVISLSDLLTDRLKIEERLQAAAKADFVIVLYNPKSKKRISLLERAWKIIMKHRSPETPVGIVKNAYREREEVSLISLNEAPSFKDIDMVTTIIVGNQKTFVKNGYMVTPRGYDLEGKQ
ncbi:MAG: precorrin-3B C(17)-methyltransferase [Omnitrophica WOR_2 bacterium RIFCSPHIGHO2_01_FULL_49_10]|nr:MAG: precorrin-3B C(17)-methyltransferase [Omnitrophica WOR_2 bacterium RIFCSPHIGHO2_01_FULL_49_10]